jgi:nucleoside-diphosphate-sugar epimerase
MNVKQIDFIKADAAEVLDDNLEQLKRLKGKTIFISGASGFVGKWVIELVNYLNENYQFNICVIASSRNIEKTSKSYPEIFNKKHIRMMDADAKNLTELGNEVSYVLHLAASPDNREHASDPVRVMNDIFVGTQKILDACTRLDRLENFTHFSSGLVYGLQTYSSANIKEENFSGFSCSSLNSVYSEAKRASEAVAQSYRSTYKIPLTVLRPFAFIGPYQSIDRPWAINNFIRDCLLSQPIRILGDEETIRSYMYPSEMAYWTLLSLLSISSGSSYNLGSDDGMSLRAIAQIIEKNFDKRNGIISTVPVHSSLLTKFVPSIDRFENTFNVKLKINTLRAIEKSVSWYRLSL